MARSTKPTRTKPGAEIKSRIADVEKGFRNVLDLSDMELREVPASVLRLAQVEGIDLSGNSLRSVPARFSELPRLKWLNLIGNPLSFMPNLASVIVVDGPTYLRCRNHIKAENIHLVLGATTPESSVRSWVAELRTLNGIRKLTIGEWAMRIGVGRPAPSEAMQRVLDTLADIDGLEDLALRGIAMQSVPNGIRELRHLRSLDLSGLGLVALPDWIGELGLVRLSLTDNKLSDLPRGLSNLTQLESLNLHCNPLNRIPPVVFELASLEHLGLHRCGIREIPADILRLARLTELDALDGHGGMWKNIESPPAEIAKRGLDAIRDYWRQRSDSGVDYLCEAKLIILGEPGAGKTSLARKIENPDYELQERERSTEGIDVICYRFPTAVRTRHDGREEVLPRKFRVNIWDFGGQEIYHATHQFFLTRRSVYVLVCDDRKEDTDFSYWLEVVEMLSDASPLLIVQNEKQDRVRDINLSSLRARFGNLRDALATNLDTNRGLDRVIRAIKRELECLPHVGVGLPATWKRVRQALEQDMRDYIELGEYLNICADHGFSRREDKLQLSGYLHDMGICLHFQDDALLKNVVILKPSWGTDAVYRVLDDAEVIASRGQFGEEQLARIWSDDKYAGMQDELLRLMMKFQLCYALPSDGMYIAPQLLSSDRPSSPWVGAHGLVVRYVYGFLPKGMVTRFIVAMHRLIAGGRLVWKTGVVLEREGTFAEIVEEYSHRRIVVRIAGPNPHALLAIVDEQLERLHLGFPRLQCERYLPCPCNECQMKSDPSGFALEQLLKMARKRQSIQCHASGHMIDADTLLRDVLPGALQREELSLEGADSLASGQIAVRAVAPEVYVSYAWNDESRAIVDKLQQMLSQHGIQLIRDREEVRYRDSIRDFMRRIGEGKCVIVVISQKYLKSENCMFELVQVAKAEHLRDRIFPIVLPDANIYKATGRVSYVQYWEGELQELDKALKTVRGDNLVKLQEDLNVYAEIRRLFDGIADVLRDMNALTPDQHDESGFDEMIRRIRAQLET